MIHSLPKQSFFFFALSLLSLFLFPRRVFAAIELTFSSPPAEISADQEFTVDVTLTGADEGKSYYIKGAFFQETGKYFGYSQNNNGEWKSWNDEFTQFFKITGNQTLPIKFKPDSTNSNFKGTGQYNFKLKRITEGGSETWHDQTATLTITQTSTPTITPEPTASQSIPTNISLSEIYGCPGTDEKEWVEIYNNNDQEFSLTDWKIRDSTENNKHTFSLTIAPHALLAIELNNSILNNSGDTVKLLNTLDQVQDEMSYPTCESNKSWIKHDGSWKETLSITKGGTNSYSAPTTKPPDPTNTPKPTSTPKPSATSKPTITSKTTSAQQILDENGELILDSTLSALESSPSGLVLGIETGENLNLPSEEEKNQESPPNQTNSKTTAIAALILGGLIFSGIGGYMAWMWYVKQRS